MLTPLGTSDRRSVGPYKLRGRLGSGGMGTVYLGVSPDGQPVAVKVIRSDLLDEPEFRGRFRREVSAAARVRGNCVAQVLDADPDADEPWMVTEYVEGANLMAAVTRGGRLTGASLLTLAVGLAEGLVAVHAANVVHRDLKPANILLSWEGPKIIDFGLARAEDLTSNTSTGNVIGTVAWMAPEQLNGDPATRATDIFTWGMCVAFAARGRHPFEAQTAAATAMRILSTEPALDDVPAEVLPAVTAALSRDPAQRPDAVALVAVLTGQPVTGPLDAGPAARRLLADWEPPGAVPVDDDLAMAAGRSDGAGVIPAAQSEASAPARAAGVAAPQAGPIEAPSNGIGTALAGLVAALTTRATPAPVEDPNETTAPLTRPPAPVPANEAASVPPQGDTGPEPRPAAAGSERAASEGTASERAASERAEAEPDRPAAAPAAAAPAVAAPAAISPAATAAAPAQLGARALRRRRRRRRFLMIALVAVIVLLASLIASPLLEANRDGSSPTAAASASAGLSPVSSAGPAGAGGVAGAHDPARGPGQVSGAPATAPDGSQLSPTAADASASPSGQATAPLPEATTTGRPIDAAPAARTVVINSGGGPVTVYYGPTTLSLFGGASGTVASGTPVDVYCGVYAQQVTAGDTTTRLWVYTSSGWIPAGYIQSGTAPPSSAPACVGTVSRPQLGSSQPRSDTGPFPVTKTVAILQIVGGVVGALTNALLGADPVGQLVGGSLVMLRCQQTDGNNTVWDELVSGGWIQHSYVYSGTNGSPAPSC